MRRLAALLLTLLLACAGTSAGAPPRPPSLAGHWTGRWVRNGEALDVWVDFDRSGPGYVGSFGSDELRVLGIPFRSVDLDSSRAHWRLVGDETALTFDGVLSGDSLNGVYRENGAAGTFRLHRGSEATSAPYTTEEVTFPNGNVRLAGSLLVPPGVGPHPAIVFVHGSGAEGRYASRYLADRFARAGFVALIYDKRGVGASTGDWRHATFDDLAVLPLTSKNHTGHANCIELGSGAVVGADGRAAAQRREAGQAVDGPRPCKAGKCDKVSSGREARKGSATCCTNARRASCPR